MDVSSNGGAATALPYGGLPLPAERPLPAVDITIRPAFFVGPHTNPEDIVNRYFPGVLELMEDFFTQHGEKGNKGYIATYCLNLFNLEGQLANQEWLDDVGLTTGLRMMLFGLPEVYTTDVIFNSRQDKGDPTKTFASKRTCDKRWWVMAANRNNNHWMLLILDRDKSVNTLYVLDSLGDGDNATGLAREWLEWSKPARIAAETDGATATPAIQFVQQTPQYTNWSCGLHVIDFARVFFRECMGDGARVLSVVDWVDSAMVVSCADWVRRRLGTGASPDDALALACRVYIRCLLGGSCSSPGAWTPLRKPDKPAVSSRPLRDPQHPQHLTAQKYKHMSNTVAALMITFGDDFWSIPPARLAAAGADLAKTARDDPEVDDIIRPDRMRTADWKWILQHRVLSIMY